MAKGKSMPTMADVAREAGVALGTVSRVVNGQQVGGEFKEKVEAAIQHLGYQYNASGRNLRTDRTNTIALIIPNTINPYFALLVHHINIALEKRNYRMLLCFTEYDRNREMEFIQMVRQNRVDGIIALTYNPSLNIPDDIPFVTIDRFFSVSVPCIAADNFGGGWLAAKKLREFGCKNVAFIRIGSTLTNEPSKRKDGFVSACVEMGLPFEVMALEDGAPFSQFEDFLTSHMENGQLAFDGLFVGTDSLAWQIIQVLKRLGLGVPEDVQVIGFDGIRMFGDLSPVVSTIVQPVQEIAEASVSTVLSKHLSNVPSLICLPVQYTYGGTTRE
ncbi:MAG: LacI family DNA-binding transcriptional regulator [Clostridia bacterium]|nr:LacI family DNA-binding transcriptional regulator [Clostridia bacterium]